MLYIPPIRQVEGTNPDGKTRKTWELDQNWGIDERNNQWEKGSCNAKKMNGLSTESPCHPFKKGSGEFYELLNVAITNADKEGNNNYAKFKNLLIEVKNECDTEKPCEVFPYNLEEEVEGNDLIKIHMWLGPRLRTIKEFISAKIKEKIKDPKGLIGTMTKEGLCKGYTDSALKNFVNDHPDVFTGVDAGSSLFNNLVTAAQKSPPSGEGFVLSNGEIEEFIFGFMTELM